jgi:hypothetical protein
MTVFLGLRGSRDRDADPEGERDKIVSHGS